MGFLAAVPGFLLGVAVSVAVGIAAGGHVSRLLGVRSVLGSAIILSLGIVLSATLTPQREAIEFGAVSAGTCDLTRIGLAPLARLRTLNDVSVNILLFVPLGTAIGLAPGSRRKVAVVIAAVALPFAIELTQLLAPVLDRACQSADVVDNLSGLVFGLAAGTVAGRLGRLS